MCKVSGLSLVFGLTLGLTLGVGPVAPGQEKASLTQEELAASLPSAGAEVRRFVGHRWHILGVAFSPDGKRVASTGYDMTVKLWDPASGHLLLNLQGHAGGAVDDVAFTPDGKHLASAGAGDSTVKVWNTTTGEAVATLHGHRTSVYGVAISPDGKHLASGSGDQTVKVWKVASGKELRTLQGPGMGLVYRVAYSPDGKLLASGGGVPRVWDAESGQEIRSFAKAALLVAFSPDSQHLATASGPTVSVWDLSSGREILSFSAQSAIWGLAYSPDGKRLATAGDLTVKIWDSASGKEELTLKGHTDMVRCVVFSPDGRQVLSGSNDLTVRLWRLPGGEPKVLFDDRKRLEGTWSCSSLKHDGRDAPAEFIKDLQVVVTGDTYFSKRCGIDGPVSIYKLDPTANPKTIEVAFVQGPKRGETQQGIYKLEGDTLTIGSAEPGRQRPTEFAARSGSSHSLIVLKREKGQTPMREGGSQR